MTEGQLTSLLSPNIVATIASIHEIKGRQHVRKQLKPAAFDSLRETAMVQSTGSSNRIEGISTSDARLKALVAQKTMPRDRSEQEIVGYRNVLSMIHENHEFIPITGNVILQLHRDLFAQTGLSFGGHWKDVDNVIVETATNGVRQVRFRPTSALETPAAIDQLCAAHAKVTRREAIDPLIIAAVFTFDFVSIHPFNDGNGRMSRLMTLLLLYKAGYSIGAYISLEQEIESSKVTYYEALRKSSAGWAAGQNDYAPIVEYLLGIVLGAYRKLDDFAQPLIGNRTSKLKRVESAAREKLGAFTKADLVACLPDISTTTVERALGTMLKSGKIAKTGNGRGTKYYWIER